jgi:hypothetical protein
MRSPAEGNETGRIGHGRARLVVTSVKLVEIRVRREVAIGQAARGGIWIGSAVSVAASSAMASTCM